MSSTLPLPPAQWTEKEGSRIVLRRPTAGAGSQIAVKGKEGGGASVGTTRLAEDSERGGRGVQPGAGRDLERPVKEQKEREAGGQTDRMRSGGIGVWEAQNGEQHWRREVILHGAELRDSSDVVLFMAIVFYS